MIKRATISIAILMMIVACTHPAPLTADQAASLLGKVKSGDADAYNTITAAAYHGDPEGEVALGESFIFGGLGGNNSTDWDQALIWFRKAADQDNAGGQFLVGVAYSRTNDAKPDYTEAVKWYRKSAEHGFLLAEYDLAGMYERGEGVTQDYAKAKFWFQKAADQGQYQSQDILSNMYLKGEGVQQNYLQAYKWLKITAAGISKPGTEMYQDEVGDVLVQVVPHLTADQMAHGDQLASDWLASSHFHPGDSMTAAAANGLAERAINDGESSSVEVLQQAADTGEIQAAYVLGIMNGNGEGIPQNSVEALKWMEIVKASTAPGTDMYNGATGLMTIAYKSLTPAQVAQAQQEASVWWNKLHKTEPINTTSDKPK